jgi:hypothetical protein
VSTFDLPLLDVIGPGLHYQVRPAYFDRNWLVLAPPAQICDSLKEAKVELKGSVATVLLGPGPSVAMPLGATRAVKGAGQCFSSVMELPGPGPMGARERMVQAACESPGGYELPVFARLLWRSEGNRWGETLGGITGLHLLGPLERVDATFLLGQGEVVPPDASVEFISEIPHGWQLVNLDLRDIRLADYMVR